MKIFFSGSIRGGRDEVSGYQALVNTLKKHGEVLTEHIAENQLDDKGETFQTDAYIYNRDLAWLKDADVVVAEVSTPSLGVGFEICKALEMNKKILCLYKKSSAKKLSAMVAGCPNLLIHHYENLAEAAETINKFFYENILFGRSTGGQSLATSVRRNSKNT